MDKLFVRKDVYDELIEKGFGKRDLSKLTKKQITDKNGYKRTVYVRNGEQPAAQKQPTAQEGLSDEKRAKYEEMLEKVKAGPDENALFVRGKMLNKKDAIAHLEEKLGKKPVSSAAQGHLESDTPQNTDITKEDEKRFGKQALSGLSGKRTSDEEMEDSKGTIKNYKDAHAYLTKLKPSSSELKDDFEDHRDIVLKRFERGEESFDEVLKNYEKEMKISVPHMVESGIMTFEEGNNYIKAWEDLKKQI